MSDSSDRCQLTLILETDNTDLSMMRDLTSRLRDELLNGDVLSVEITRNPVANPANTKSPSAIANDPILLSLSIAALPSIILLIQQWILRQQNQTIKVKIGEVELDVPRNISQSELDQIVKAARGIPQPSKHR